MVTPTPHTSDSPLPAAAGRVPPLTQAGSVAQLVEAREAAGMTSADVAARLGMTVRQIEYLEAGAWDRLPGRPFIVSGLRAYGRAVRVDVELLVNSVRGTVQGAETLKPVAQLDQPMPRRGALGFGGGGSGSFRTWLVFILILILALAFFYGGGATYLGMSAPAIEGGRRGELPSRNGQSGKPSGLSAQSDVSSSLVGGLSERQTPSVPASASTAASVASMAATEVATSAQSQSAPSSTVTVPTTRNQSVTPSTVVVPSSVADASRDRTVAPGSESAALAISGRAGPVQSGASAATAFAPDVSTPRSASAAASAAALASNAAGLVLSFELDSWIEIKDADGRVLVVGTERSGSTRAVEGRAPFSLIIGNAQGVRLSHRGRAVNLEPHTQRGIARVVVE